MPFCAALAGPGPRTLAFRLATCRTLCATPSMRCASTRPSQRSLRARGAPVIQKNRSIPASVNVIHVPAPSALQTPAKALNLLQEALGAFDGTKLVKAWSQLLDLRKTRDLNDAFYARISELVVRLILFQQWQIGKLAIDRPEVFGLLRDMSIEAASRDHYKGLHSFLLTLIRLGRPGLVDSAFQNYKERIRDVQGRDARDLHSLDRSKRLGARITGDGIRPLTLLQITALTMLDKFDGPAILSIADTQADFRQSAYLYTDDIRKALGDDVRGVKVFDYVSKNIETYKLALECYHPVALENRIAFYTEAGNIGKVENYYDRLMELSIGPRKIIRATDLKLLSNHRDAEFVIYREIPFTVELWIRFLISFRFAADVDRIVRMLAVDMPARGLVLDGPMLSHAMVALTGIYTSSNSSPTAVRMKAKHEAERLWSRIIGEGMHNEDHALGGRIHMLGQLQHQQAVYNMYDAHLLNHYGEIGYRTQCAFITFFITDGQLDKAIQVIERAIERDGGEGAGTKLFEAFIKTIISSRESIQQKRYGVLKVLAMKPKDVKLNSLTLGYLLAYFTMTGLPVDKAIDLILDNLYDGQPSCGVKRWQNMLEAFLTRRFHAYHPSEAELFTSLKLLKEFTMRQVDGISHTKVSMIWGLFLQNAAGSEADIDPSVRRRMIEAALDLFPIQHTLENVMPVGLYLNIINRSLQRAGGAGVPEALVWWEEAKEKDDFHGTLRTLIVRGLVKHGRSARAKLVVEEAVRDGVRGNNTLWRLGRDLGVPLQRGGVDGREDSQEIDELLIQTYYEPEDDEERVGGSLDQEDLLIQ
ncbi:hypothetical protein P7C73_g5757, partial [Tremellales sp. Uapishka_1]